MSSTTVSPTELTPLLRIGPDVKPSSGEIVIGAPVPSKTTELKRLVIAIICGGLGGLMPGITTSAAKWFEQCSGIASDALANMFGAIKFFETPAGSSESNSNFLPVSFYKRFQRSLQSLFKPETLYPLIFTVSSAVMYALVVYDQTRKDPSDLKHISKRWFSVMATFFGTMPLFYIGYRDFWDRGKRVLKHLKHIPHGINLVTGCAPVFSTFLRSATFGQDQALTVIQNAFANSLKRMLEALKKRGSQAPLTAMLEETLPSDLVDPNTLDSETKFTKLISIQDIEDCDSKVRAIQTPVEPDCLFYSAAFAFLLPVVEVYTQFAARLNVLLGSDSPRETILSLQDQFKLYRGELDFLEKNAEVKKLINQFRQRVVNYIENNSNVFKGPIECSIPFADYIAHMKKPETWGTEYEILAISKIFNVTISIYTVEKENSYIHHRDIGMFAVSASSSASVSSAASASASVSLTPISVKPLKLAVANKTVFSDNRKASKSHYHYLFEKNLETKESASLPRVINLKDRDSNYRYYYEVETPMDGTCLFYTIVFAYLLPVVYENKDKTIFQARFEELFGKKNDAEQNEVNEVDAAYIRGALQYFAGNINFILENTNLFETWVNVCFRRRVVNYIKTHPAEFEALIQGGFGSYLARMEDATIKTWGTEIEIKAMSHLLNCSIHVYESLPSGYVFIKSFLRVPNHASGKNTDLYILQTSFTQPDYVRIHYHPLLSSLNPQVQHDESRELGKIIVLNDVLCRPPLVNVDVGTSINMPSSSVASSETTPLNNTPINQPPSSWWDYGRYALGYLGEIVSHGCGVALGVTAIGELCDACQGLGILSTSSTLNWVLGVLGNAGIMMLYYEMGFTSCRAFLHWLVDFFAGKSSQSSLVAAFTRSGNWWQGYKGYLLQGLTVLGAGVISWNSAYTDINLYNNACPSSLHRKLLTEDIRIFAVIANALLILETFEDSALRYQRLFGAEPVKTYIWVRELLEKWIEYIEQMPLSDFEEFCVKDLTKLGEGKLRVFLGARPDGEGEVNRSVNQLKSFGILRFSAPPSSSAGQGGSTGASTGAPSPDLVSDGVSSLSASSAAASTPIPTGNPNASTAMTSTAATGSGVDPGASFTANLLNHVGGNPIFHAPSSSETQHGSDPTVNVLSASLASPGTVSLSLGKGQ